MDAPPDKEDCRAFVHVADLMAQAGLHVPAILAWDEPQGFMLLQDVGRHTMMDVIQREDPAANQGLYLRAVDALIAWQRASKPAVLPVYDQALLARELQLFPDWYLARHRGVTVEGAMRETLDAQFRLIIERNLASPSVRSLLADACFLRLLAPKCCSRSATSASFATSSGPTRTACPPATPRAIRNPDLLSAIEKMVFFKAEGVLAVFQCESGWLGAVRGFSRPGSAADRWSREGNLASPVVVASGATLAASGTSTGSLTLNAGSALTASTAGGLLTFNGVSVTGSTIQYSTTPWAA
jgi:hypothetical protein